MNRELKILEIVTKNKKISVKDLSMNLKVSEVTIRKDLDRLQERGIVNREHGFALSVNNDDILRRLAFNYSIKLKIAKLASTIVKEGETVMIESGSTCALLSEELAKRNASINIVTNSIFIANFLRNYSEMRITILGGEFQRESQVNTGPLVKMCAGLFKVDKLFVGCDGFTEDRGFTGANILRSEVAREMSKSANKVIVLTDSSKFGKEGLVNEFSKEEVNSVFTDSKIDDEYKKILERANIKIETA